MDRNWRRKQTIPNLSWVWAEKAEVDLGWTHQEIAEVVGLSQQRIQQITNNVDFDKICNEIQRHLKQRRNETWLVRHSRHYRFLA